MAKNGSLRAVVLAAGQGKRMKSRTPKVLHDVLGRTILTRVLDGLSSVGGDGSTRRLERAHIVVGHDHARLDSYLARTPPPVPYETHLQEPQLGTGHALMQVVESLEGFQGNLIVTVGDAPIVRASTYLALLTEHETSGAAVTVLSALVDDPKSYGRIVRDENCTLKAIVEARDATEDQLAIKEINTAIYCLSWPEVKPGLDSLSDDNDQKEYYLPDLVGWAAAQGRGLAVVVAPDWREVAGINSRLELAELLRHLKDMTVEKLALESGVTIVDPASTWIAPEVEIGQDTIVYPGCQIIGDVHIGADCVIGPGAIIKGDVAIGDRSSVVQSVVLDSAIGADCKIGPFSHVREGNTVSEGVRVGNFVELKKTTIGSSTNVSHLSYVGDAEVGSNANIGAGTITANYDHITRVKNKTVIGDGASTGSNSVLVAPVKLGLEASVAACTAVTKDVPDGALAVGRARQENKEGWAKRRKSRTVTR